MTIHEAIILIRKEFLEEQQRKTEGSTLKEYKMAIDRFPAVMNVAHTLFAIEINKTS